MTFASKPVSSPEGAHSDECWAELGELHIMTGYPSFLSDFVGTLSLKASKKVEAAQ